MTIAATLLLTGTVLLSGAPLADGESLLPTCVIPLDELDHAVAETTEGNVDLCPPAVVSASTQEMSLLLYDPLTLAPRGSFELEAAPYSVAVGPDGTLYAGQLSQIVQVDPATGEVSLFNRGDIAGYVYGLTTDEDGFIYASGSSMDDVRVFNSAGHKVGSIVVPEGSNHRSTAFGPDGDFYLTSFGGDQVERWSSDFTYEGAFGGAGLRLPFGIGTRSNGDVLISSQGGSGYFVFGSDGGFRNFVIVECSGQIRNLAVDDDDNVWVTCFGQDQIVKFDDDNEEVGRIDTPRPSGVAVK